MEEERERKREREMMTGDGRVEGETDSWRGGRETLMMLVIRIEGELREAASRASLRMCSTGHVTDSR